MINLRSLRNIATFFCVVLTVAGLVSSFNYAHTTQQNILGTLDNLSPELLIIRYQDPSFSQVEDDMHALRAVFNHDILITPLIINRTTITNLQKKKQRVFIVQLGEQGFDILPITLQHKETQFSELTANTKQFALISSMLEPHFSASQPVQGMSLQFFETSCLIVGTFECNERLLGINWDQAIITQFSKYGSLNPNGTMQLLVHFKSGITEQKIEKTNSTLMNTRNNKDFTSFHFQEMLENKKQIASVITLLTESISLLILAMASVGCMNTFFMTVTERTREIGLRRALGATNMEIVLLIMGDCYLFMAIGTVIGLVCGHFLTEYLLAPMINILPGFHAVDKTLHWTAISKTLFFLTLSSTLSAIFPAIRASRIEPALALRE